MNLNKEKIKNLILEIMAKAIDKTNNSESDVFVNFVAHVNSLEVTIHKEGWQKYHDSGYSNEMDQSRSVVYLDKKEDVVIKKLEDVLTNINLLA